jgi:hypothetical protein
MEIQGHDLNEYGERADSFPYDGYEVTRGVFFAHIFEPTIRLIGGKVFVNVACLKKMPDTEYVQFLVNRAEKKLAVKPCSEDTKDSFKWLAVGKDGKVRPRIIPCKPFYEKIMKLMNWDPDTGYRIIGKFIRTKTECLFVFDLKDVEIGIKRGVNTYPEEWGDGFGLSAHEHSNGELVNLCENDLAIYPEESGSCEINTDLEVQTEESNTDETASIADAEGEETRE